MHYLSQSLSPLLVLLLPSFIRAQTTVITITAPPSVPTNPPQYVSDSTFESAILNSTNLYRRQHNATAVTYNDTLADFAQNYANECQFQHSHGPYGENLAEGYANVTEAVDVWGNERAKYNFGDPGFSEATGHFTQLVWKNTTSTGCGRTFCNGRNQVSGWYVVCEYFPPGNVIGEFNTQVQAQTTGTSGATGVGRGLGRTTGLAVALSGMLVWMLML